MNKLVCITGIIAVTIGNALFAGCMTQTDTVIDRRQVIPGLVCLLSLIYISGLSGG